MTELIPTRPAPPPDQPQPRPPGPWTPEEQAQHRADMLAALDGWHYHQPDPDEPNLRLVTDTNAA
ncbi:hypothetical protein [Streptomyces sp. NPDC056188]|uniref:hypothetical protein n=1 Tax=Streptomyces sp. NPDC056188 TaxID=3345740 RepID=UPI0035D64F05